MTKAAVLGVYLLRFSGILCVVGGLLALIGADIAVYGPLLLRTGGAQ
jgi:hypothetical protein